MNKSFIYLDESGDLGFKKGSSKYFVLFCKFHIHLAVAKARLSFSAVSEN